MDGVFILGTDTGVGKTVVSAGLLKLIQGARKVAFWKPIQTGTIVGDDTSEVKDLTSLDSSYFVEPAYRFPEPLAPLMAAKKWSKTISVNTLVEKVKEKTKEKTFLIIEGAGGLLVPLNEKELQIDFVKATGFPVVFVGQDRVGAINQALLSIRAARDANLEVLGIIITRSQGIRGNAECIHNFGKVEILAELHPREDKRSIVAEVGGHVGLRKLFGVPTLPV